MSPAKKPKAENKEFPPTNSASDLPDYTEGKSDDTLETPNNTNNTGILKVLEHPLVKQLDRKTQDLFEKLSKYPMANRIFYTASQLGDNALIWQLFAAVKALFGGKLQEKAYYRITAALAFESFLVNGVLKSLFPRGRPNGENVEDRPLYLRQPITASFPSGHASAATLAAILLNTRKRKSPFSLLTWIIAGIVAFSRVHVKIHHASDVFAGAAVGYTLAKLLKRIWKLTS